jgi:hypothetical protein
MDKIGLSYIQKENCFTWLEDELKTNELIQKQLLTQWTDLLNIIARQLNPIHQQIFSVFKQNYYWTVHQREWTTDIMFRDSKTLDMLYPSLIRYGIIKLNKPPA